MPFKSDAEYYTGFVSNREKAVPNSFMWEEQGKPVFFGVNGEKVIDYQHKVLEHYPQKRVSESGSGANDEQTPHYNHKRFKLLPLTYIRGMNIESSVVIIDEMQNMSREECRAIRSRMGEGVKCICMGNIHQVDNPYLNTENNGLNWIVNKFKGSKIYAHLMLKGEKSRGPITDLVIKSGL